MRMDSIRTRFALRFIRSLARIRTTADQTPNFKTSGRLIKLAADASMASAVGGRRSWSRAVLFKIRNRARLHKFGRHKVVSRKKKKRKMIKRSSLGGVDGLRRVVPGGESMDLFKLLEETAHYMKCLNTQVEVMQSIVNLYSPTT